MWDVMGGIRAGCDGGIRAGCDGGAFVRDVMGGTRAGCNGGGGGEEAFMRECDGGVVCITYRHAKSHSFGVRLTHFEPISLLNQIKFCISSMESHSF